MKKLLLMLFSVFAVQMTFSQVASDYYLPFCVGNQTVFNTAQYGSYSARLTTYTFIGTEIIDGKLYYIEEGKEYSYFGSEPDKSFRNLWLRKDVSGNIYLKAFSEEYPILDSAEVFPTELLWFSNNYLTLGYSVTQTLDVNQTVTDSVVSINATCGNFHNCIQVRDISKDSGVIGNVDDIYYAYGVGMVGINRITQNVHTDVFASTFVTGCEPIVDSLTNGNIIDTCFGQYFDYYIGNVVVDSTNNTIDVTWVFQDDSVANQFVETYNYQHEGNNVVSITIQCFTKKSAVTYYKTINIGFTHLSVNENSLQKSEISIYPNPAKDNITVSNSNNQSAVLYIYNIIGKLVRTEFINIDNQKINIANLSNGIYMIEIKGSNILEKQKLIIQR